MLQSQTREDVVWIPNYDDIDPVEVEADLRREEERRNPQKYANGRLNEVARKEEQAQITAEGQETRRNLKIEKVEAKLNSQQQDLRAIAEQEQPDLKFEELRRSELLQAKYEAEIAQAEAQRIIALAQQSVQQLALGNITKNEAQNAISAAKLIPPLSLENLAPNQSMGSQAPPWGNGFETGQKGANISNSGGLLSPLFVSASKSPPPPQGAVSPLSSDPLAGQETLKKKPMLGAAFGGGNSVA